MAKSEALEDAIGQAEQHPSSTANDQALTLSATDFNPKANNSDVTFEEYLYYAKVSRADERYEDWNPDYTLFGFTLKRNSRRNETPAEAIAKVQSGETTASDVEGEFAAKEADSTTSKNRADRFGITDSEYTHASRALRTAGWTHVFYLITTDILGPFSVPQAIAYMGYGPGIVLFTVFGFFAGYGGFLLWKLFLALDSDRYPLRTYGDLGQRIYGSWARYGMAILQFIQLLFNVGIIIIQNGLSLEQIITGSGRPGFCFVVLALFFTIAGGILGQVRTLRNIGWIGTVSIFLNVFTIIVIMAVVPHSEPNYDVAAQVNGPILGYTASDPHIVMTSAGAPAKGINVQAQGLSVAVFAYGGATVFIELIGEMRKPFDFWKGMVCAQVFIFGFYLLFGVFVYSYQGQYTINPAYQSIGPYVWQTVGNSVQLVTALIAALLYGNVGLKILYNVILKEIFHFPELVDRSGKIAWAALIPVYWAVGFIIGAAIPSVVNLVSIVGALCTLQFSYTFPPFLFVGYLVKRNAMSITDGFNPVTGQTVRHDSGMRRWVRGFMMNWKLNSFHTIYFLGALTTSAFGIYASIIGLEAQYAQGSQSGFSCYSIYNPNPNAS